MSNLGRTSGAKVPSVVGDGPSCQSSTVKIIIRVAAMFFFALAMRSGLRLNIFGSSLFLVSWDRMTSATS